MELRKSDIVGNNNLSSTEESQVAEYLRIHYLEKTNGNSLPVRPRNTFYTRVMKRILDIAIALPAFLLLLPLNAILGICTFYDVGCPIFYKQTRVGRYEKGFVLIKFRNMNEKKDTDGNLLPPSQRDTKFGKFMRKTSLDELLNFWSVIKGDMSIIGPRPMPVFLYERLSNRHKMRTAVRPGLECPRVVYADRMDMPQYQRTYENDIWYVENISFLVDIKLCFMLLKMVFSGKRKNQAEGKGVSYFVGYNEECMAMSLINYRDMSAEKKASMGWAAQEVAVVKET